MNKREAIALIEALYPADSDYPSTSETGQKLLMKAIKHNWRNLSEDMLITYANFCRQRVDNGE